ncbi:MAG: DUF885 domain-containing protein [Thermoanaerobaculales bacterium]|jgi:uncharacterized protein (DUF885 family)|nr:DUF885 domain-containing protein [Thermoanaerobaculales bacterium]
MEALINPGRHGAHRAVVLAIVALTTSAAIGCGGVGPAADPPGADDKAALVGDYLASWAGFHPSRALSAGDASAAPRFEDRSGDAVDAWLEVNRSALDRLAALPEPASLDERIDRRLLERQIRLELAEWGETEAHRVDPRVYADLANHALTTILVRGNLDDAARLDAVLGRLSGLERLCATAETNLVDGRPFATATAIADLRATADFVEADLAAALGVADDPARSATLTTAAGSAAAALRGLADRLETGLPTSLPDAWGEELYARRLALAYGDGLTPEALERLATDEIETARGLMEALARREWPASGTGFDHLLRPILDEMESRRAGSQRELLDEFLGLVDRSRRFVEEQDLADLPESETLVTGLSPEHFAGAAVGGVYSAGPFDPEAETLFYLPSVPDSAPEAVRDGFYRSFNTAFNTTIITHEIYPGHYLQLKLAARHPSPLRALFAGDDFTEGWASFCEQMTLDAGWDDDRPLTRMAHLRKRLENAGRAWVSVQVHCRGWGREQVRTFAVETGLLPPQFADNLWQRTLLTPIQLPSYMVGFRAFDDAWRGERARLGDGFRPRAFNDAVLGSGGVPLEYLGEVVAAGTGAGVSGS